MNKFKQQLLLSVLILSNIIPVGVRAEENKTPPEKPKESTSILQAVLRLFKSPERRLMSRGEEVCLISPGNSSQEKIWQDRPLFVWWGETSQSEINLYSEGKLIWSQTVPASTQTIAYTGEPLQPGNSYDWELISNGKEYGQTITILDRYEKFAIATDLGILSNRLKTTKATAEEKAIAKADYFVGRNLGSDALQQLYAIKNPSPNLKTQIDSFESDLCK